MDLLQPFPVGRHERRQAAEVPGQHPRDMLADLPDAEPHEEAIQRDLLASLDRGQQQARRSIGKPIQRQELGLRESIQIGQVLDEAAIDQLRHGFLAEPVDVQSGLGGKMFNGPF